MWQVMNGLGCFVEAGGWCGHPDTVIAGEGTLPPVSPGKCWCSVHPASS
jgi:hypothetical protein